MAHAEHNQILADQRHHLRDGKVAHRGEPLAFRPIEPFSPVAPGERLAGFDQIFAGIKPVRQRPDRLA